MSRPGPVHVWRSLARRALLATALLAASALAVPLASAAAVPGAPQEGWARYEVPMVDGTDGPCCHAIRGGVVQQRGCDLERKGGIQLVGGDQASPPASDLLAVYLHFRQGEVDRVRAFGGSCPVRAETPPAAVGVSPEASLALLAGLAREGKPAADEAVMVLAHHAGEAATTRLAELAAEGGSRELRKDAVFWLGQLRGDSGAAVVERIARNDPDTKLREHAVFSLSQSEAAGAFAAIDAIARTDPSERVRGQALFWMAQHGDPRAAEAILAALRREQDADLHDEAVFALSQLDHGSDAALIGVIRGDYPRKARKQALFWLGQSGSDEAIAFLDSVLSGR